MKIVYTPENGERREWPYAPGKMLSIEAEAIERVTGWTFQEFGEKFMAGSAMAQHALLWVLLRRENRGLKYSDVQFAMDEFDIEFDDDELQAMRDTLENEDLSDEDRKVLEQYLEAQPGAAEVDPTIAPADPEAGTANSA